MGLGAGSRHARCCSYCAGVIRVFENWMVGLLLIGERVIRSLVRMIEASQRLVPPTWACSSHRLPYMTAHACLDNGVYLSSLSYSRGLDKKRTLTCNGERRPSHVN
jgi:hypothetical protein